MTMLEDRLRAADPAAHVAGYTPTVATTMISEITAPVVQRRPWARWISVAAAIVLALALVTVPGLSPFHAGATAEAAGFLDKAIIGATDPLTRPDQYWKVTTESVGSDIQGTGVWGDPDTASFLRRSRRISFVAVDGSRPTWFVDRSGPYLRQVSGPPTPLPRTGWSEPDAWTTDVAAADSGGLGILGLPRVPSLLRVKLYGLAAGRGHSPDDEVVVIVGDILREGYAPAELRKALFEVLKTVPGVDVVARNATLDGRLGVGLGRSEGSVSQRRELIFAVDTGEYIGQRDIFIDLKATSEDAVSRELVDAVDPDVVGSARHEHCDVGDGGMVTCTHR